MLIEKDEPFFERLSHLLSLAKMTDDQLLEIGGVVDKALFGPEVSRTNLNTIERLVKQRTKRFQDHLVT